MLLAMIAVQPPSMPPYQRSLSTLSKEAAASEKGFPETNDLAICILAFWVEVLQHLRRTHVPRSWSGISAVRSAWLSRHFDEYTCLVVAL